MLSELVLQLMMEGESLKPAVINVPKDDVEVELLRDESDVVVMDTVAFPQKL
jgi:hypothetical protein